MNSVEKTGKTVKEATDLALSELNVKEDDAIIEVLDEGNKGIFGLFNTRMAKVKVTVKKRISHEGKEFLQALLKKMDLEAQVEVRENEELCGKKFSRSTVSDLCKKLDPIVEAFRTRPLQCHYPFLIVDAIFVNVRENGRVQSSGLLIATAVNEEGYREIIGFQLANSESESSWGEFFSSLKERGLKNVDLVTSDDHKGLVKAVRRHFQGAGWQRCQTHFSKNILDHTPKALQPEIKEELRRLYEAVDLESARNIRDGIIQNYEAKAPKATAILDEAFDDITAVLALPLRYRKRLRTTNSVERLNQEIRRRERVIRIFPNASSAIRLMGALLMEQHEKWQTGHKYFNMQLYYQMRKENDSKSGTAA
jgi:putative transposase